MKCLAVILTLASAAAMRATTINSYTFTQTGYRNPFFDETGTVTGRFTGFVEDSGVIELAGLESFSARFEIGAATLESKVAPFFFTFDTTPGAGSSTLGIAVLISRTFALCIGAPAAFELPPCAFQMYPGAPSPVNGSLGSVIPTYTAAFPTLELVSSLILTTADTPEPATSILLGLGLCGLGLARRGGRE